MKKKISLPFLVILFSSMLYWACNKIHWKDIGDKPQVQKCDVTEYHLPYYDDYEIGFPFLFKKKYDQSGRNVQEIDCSFWYAEVPDQFKHHILLVYHNSNLLLLLNKNNPLDTVMKAYFNNAGRVTYYECKGELLYPDYFEILVNFSYKSNRLDVVDWLVATEQGSSRQQDTLHYDIQGNLLAFGPNAFAYDYSKKIKQQFLVDDFMNGYLNGYYLLQYLGYFPEVTSPPNLRIHKVYNEVNFADDFVNHTIDSKGRLTSYQFSGGATATIVWNCNN